MALEEMLQYARLFKLLRILPSWRDEAWAAGNQDKATKMEEAIAQREAELQDLVPISAEYDALQTDVQQAREAYAFLLVASTAYKTGESQKERPVLLLCRD